MGTNESGMSLETNVSGKAIQVGRTKVRTQYAKGKYKNIFRQKDIFFSCIESALPPDDEKMHQSNDP
jgi:hypothetical protein